MTDTRGATAATPGPGPSDKAERPGRMARISLYYRQVIAEMRKVIWPTRSELITYTTVVIVFVLIVLAYISVLDLGFGRLALLVFG